MKLRELIRDNRNSLTDQSRKHIDATGIQNDLRHLARFTFWEAPVGQPRLWEHQRAAIATVVAYLNGDKSIPERPREIEASLLKLPTGTGKSGIITVLGRCLPNIRRVLVLTPRTALAEQLLKDILYRFWEHLGYEVDSGNLFTADAAVIGNALEHVYVEQLLPRNVNSLIQNLDHEDIDRAIVVGTHQALGSIRKIAFDTDNRSSVACLTLLDKIKDTFDLVIADEGHYEPAISWSRGVREFNLPTLLLSATPYRNDYKSFRVRGRYLFNYPYQQAVQDRIIRPVEVIVPRNAPEHDGDAAINQFVQMLQDELRERLSQTARWFREDDAIPKVMVRADDLETLVQLQQAIDQAFRTESILIHERAKKTVENRNRFVDVASAIRAQGNAQFWIHQNKLMEGIDDPSFVAVAIFDLMGNARQLVQQIGRVTRYSKGDRRVNQTGWVLASTANAERIRTVWERYKGYEQYAANNTLHIVANEVALPDRLLKYMAEYQYVSGEFRSRFEYEAPLESGDIQIPKSAAILNSEGQLPDISEFANAMEDAIMDRDRFKITRIENMPQGTIGFSYYSWRNSPYLVERFFSEWKLGIFIAVQHEDLVFMYDTEGLVVNISDLKLKRAGRSLMEKVFPNQSEENHARLSRMSFTSLDMSQQAIRSMALRTRSFEDVFTDLLDPSLVPSTAAGYVNGTARYVGFARSRLRDTSERYVPIEEYIKWTAEVAGDLTDAERQRNNVFDRYAAVVTDVSENDAAPVSILLDPSQDSFIDMREDEAEAAAIIEQEDVDYMDLCSDIDSETGQFTIKIGQEDVPCVIKYRNEQGKYHLTSDRLNELFRARDRGNRRQGQTLVQRLNQAQAFRLLVQRGGVVYSEGAFYMPRLQWRIDDDNKPILDYIHSALSLNEVDSEKGERYFDLNNGDWQKKSIFGLFSATCEDQLHLYGIENDDLTSAIEEYPIWLCDDDNQEVADFIGISPESKKITFVHAKVGNQEPQGRGFNVGGLQVVGRQALASLAFIYRGEPSTAWTSERWKSEVLANQARLQGRNRIFRNANNLATDQINEVVKSACKNPSFNKEIWVVGAKMARRDALEAGLDQEPWNNRLRQFLMHWDALQTACARANSRLKFFCS